MIYNDNDFLTLADACTLVAFIASVVANLVDDNNACLQDDDDFVRLQDVCEVIDALAMLHSKANYADYDYDYDNATAHTAKAASYNITAVVARDAILSYDTEYRECIVEQFIDAHADLARKLNIS